MSNLFSCTRLWALALNEHDVTWRQTPETTGKRHSDATYLGMFQNSSSLMEKETLKDFLVEYGLHRRSNYLELAKTEIDLIRVQTRLWDGSTTLVERAESLKKIKGDSRKSKLAWFLNPTGWTIFDSYVSTAMGKGRKRIGFHGYYQQLQDFGYDDFCQFSSVDLKEKGLYLERVVDKLLWIMGSHNYFKRVTDFVPTDAQIEFSKSVQQHPFVSNLNSHLNLNWGIAL